MKILQRRSCRAPVRFNALVMPVLSDPYWVRLGTVPAPPQPRRDADRRHLVQILGGTPEMALLTYDGSFGLTGAVAAGSARFDRYNRGASNLLAALEARMQEVYGTAVFFAEMLPDHTVCDLDATAWYPILPRRPGAVQ